MPSPTKIVCSKIELMILINISKLNTDKGNHYHHFGHYRAVGIVVSLNPLKDIMFTTMKG